MDLLDPGIELGSPALQVDSLPTELSGKPKIFLENAFVLLVFSFAALVCELSVKNVFGQKLKGMAELHT